MLTIAQIRGDGSYYTALGRDDYYLKGGEPRGLWFGTGAVALGLAGVVEDIVYRRLLGGFSPDGSHALVNNAGSGQRRPGWDLTFSIPKSVSELLAAIAIEMPEVADVLRDSVKRAAARSFAYLEQKAAVAREGLGGKTRVPVRLMAAGFEHSTNRNLDAQVHWHFVVVNVGVGLDGVTRSIVSKTLYRHKMAAGVLFRAELAAQLRTRLGLKLVAKSSWFEIAGVPESLIEAGSSRRKEILAELKRTGYSSPIAAKIAALETREAKTAPPREILFERWSQLAKQHGLTPEIVRQLMRPEVARLTPKISSESVRDSVARLLESQSYFSERDLVRAIAERTQSLGVGADPVLVSARKALDGLIYLGRHKREKQFTTAEMLAAEKRLIALALRERKSGSQLVAPDTVQAILDRHTLSGEQAEALRHITLRPGRIQLVQGFAGTGKSTLLAAAREAFEREGYQVLGCSLSGKAAEGLERASGITSHTIARLMLQWGQEFSEVPYLNSKSVLVVDEAAMVGTLQMAKLFEYVLAAQAKLILVGDARQLPAIAAGAPFASISNFLGSASLTDIRRQFADWGRNLVRQFADGDVREGVKLWRDRGLIHIGASPESTTAQLLTEWSRETKLQDTLILAGTHEEVSWLNQRAQQIRQQAGQLGSEPIRMGNREFYPGDRVIFRRNDRKIGVKNGTFGTVVGQRHGSTVIQLDASEKSIFVPSSYHQIHLGYAVTTHKAQGATVNRAFVLFSDAMQSRELTYVQVSRAREFTKLFLSREQAGDLELTDAVRAMERSQSKLNASDLEMPVNSDQEHTGRGKRGLTLERAL